MQTTGSWLCCAGGRGVLCPPGTAAGGTALRLPPLDAFKCKTGVKPVSTPNKQDSPSVHLGTLTRIPKGSFIRFVLWLYLLPSSLADEVGFLLLYFCCCCSYDFYGECVELVFSYQRRTNSLWILFPHISPDCKQCS